MPLPGVVVKPLAPLEEAAVLVDDVGVEDVVPDVVEAVLAVLAVLVAVLGAAVVLVLICVSKRLLLFTAAAIVSLALLIALSTAPVCWVKSRRDGGRKHIELRGLITEGRLTRRCERAAAG